MRFHLPALPDRPVTRANSTCAYSTKLYRFRRMMRDRGHEVTVYGGEGADVVCYPDDAELTWDPVEWGRYNDAAAVAIRERAEPRDYLCLVAGLCQQALSTAFPELMTVEPFIGYSGTFAPYRVFESYAWMHMIYGHQAANPMSDMGHFYDAVIPNYFDVDDFPFREEKKDYVLFVGRMIERKGVHIAAQAAERLGVKLLLAGHETETVPDYGEYIGPVGPGRRGVLMSKARAVFTPTLYIEPFGATAVEAQLCGTPVISTDWGAFTETVEQGVTGYRCRTLAEFIRAVEHADRLDPEVIRERAISKYSLEAIGPQFERYFERLADLYGDGWYEVPPEFSATMGRSG